MKFLPQFNIHGRIVLLRLNLNVPVRNGKIVDDFRIKAVLPTIEHVKDQAEKIVICAHLGRPQGREKGFSLKPVASYLKKLYKKRLLFLSDCVGAEVKAAVESAPKGSIILLENLRFHEGERANNQAFGRQLADLGHVFINDAFGDSYEAYASVIWPARVLPSAGGLRLKEELEALDRIRTSREHPLVLVVGGVKISEKMATLRKLGQRADTILLGGGVANTLLAASGVNIRKSLFQKTELLMAKELISRFGHKLVLPVDACAAKFNKKNIIEKRSARLCRVTDLAEGEAILDIGPDTLHRFKLVCDQAKLVFWTGPLGYIEWKQTAKGSMELLRLLAEHPNTTVIGGGETTSLVSSMRLHDKMDFVSTGGGAALKYLSGEDLPGLKELR